MNDIKKLFNKRVFLYAFLIWVNLNISGIQNIYFSEGKMSTIIIIKIIHLIFLYFLFLKINSLYANRKVPKVKNEIIISLIYCLILTVLLLLVWPGTWSSDDISVLKNTGSYNLTPWQHFFSGLFQILCLQTIPIPSGVIIVQIIIASLIVGYSISNISALYGKNKKQIRVIQIVLGLITLLPPLVMYILSGFRMGIYSYLELLLITKMIVLYKEQRKATSCELLEISIYTIIISCWRTEAIYYPIFIVILFYILGNKVIRRKTATILFFVIMIINFSIGKVNNLMIQGKINYLDYRTMRPNTYNNPIMKSNNYSLTATMEPVSTLVKISDESDKEEIDTINKVIDVEYILENPEYSGEKYFWTEEVVRDYSEEEYNNYLKAYLKLALKYPGVTFKSMWNIFYNAGSGMGKDSIQTTRNMVSSGDTLKLFDISHGSCWRWNALNSKVAKYKAPIDLEVRNAVICFLNGSDADNYINIIHNIFWNFFIPFALILICLVYKLVKKDWFMVFLILTVITRIPLVFATASAPYFMYYLSAYLCTYIISTIVIFEGIINFKNKRRLLCERNS